METMIKLAFALLLAMTPTPAQAPAPTRTPLDPAIYLKAETAIIQTMIEWHKLCPLTPKVYFTNVFDDIDKLNGDDFGSDQFNQDADKLAGDFTSLEFYVSQHAESAAI